MCVVCPAVCGIAVRACQYVLWLIGPVSIIMLLLSGPVSMCCCCQGLSACVVAVRACQYVLWLSGPVSMCCCCQGLSVCVVAVRAWQCVLLLSGPVSIIKLLLLGPGLDNEDWTETFRRVISERLGGGSVAFSSPYRCCADNNYHGACFFHVHLSC